ncbi:hypothetical protein [Streptomyces sp. NPDC014733]|uniref:hypothetical protein n=1 Tax=Streptomyces sp. NPDC014733 TaxID=3364885 RepID=UPI0036FCFC63
MTGTGEGRDGMARRSGRRSAGPAARDRYGLRGPVLRTLLLLTALLLGALPPPAGERGAVPSLPAAGTARPAAAAYAPGDALVPDSGPGTGAAGPHTASGPRELRCPRHLRTGPDRAAPAAPGTRAHPLARPAPPHAVPFTGGPRAAPVVRHPAPSPRSGPGAGPEQTYHPPAGPPPAAVLPVPPYTGPRPPRIRAASAGAPGFAALPPARAPPSSGS